MKDTKGISLAGKWKTLLLLALGATSWLSCEKAEGTISTQQDSAESSSGTENHPDPHGGQSSGSADITDPADAQDLYAQERIDCVDKINEYRATEGLPPYERWVDGEGCADDQAAYDMASGSAHDGFQDKICSDADPRAQNECPGYRSLNSVLTTCLSQMWAEGPGEPFSEHGHYINMSSTRYSKVACGFAANSSNSSIWAVQNFK
jgi:hypothetical protein